MTSAVESIFQSVLQTTFLLQHESSLHLLRHLQALKGIAELSQHYDICEGQLTNQLAQLYTETVQQKRHIIL